jgi:alpha-galactosidase/6-phospho-beta-glucosidase family protein
MSYIRQKISSTISKSFAEFPALWKIISHIEKYCGGATIILAAM